MPRLNNKGFAISAMLYTLFVVFLLIMLSVLAGLQARKTMMERSLLGLENTFAGKERSDLIAETNTTRRAPITGKYVFAVNNNGSSTVVPYCSSYLNKGDTIDNNIEFVPKDCNDYRPYNFSFETVATQANKLTLVKIYSMDNIE